MLMLERVWPAGLAKAKDQEYNTNFISIAHLKQLPLTKVLSSIITYSHTNKIQQQFNIKL